MIFNKLLKLGAMAVAAWAGSAAALDWSQVPHRDVVLFFPGTATWETLLVAETHDGAAGVRQRASCASCHEGEQQVMGESLTTDSGHPMYRAHDGMASWPTTLQIATEGDNILFRIATAGVDDGQLSLLLDDGAFESSALSGCWSSCHQDSRGMPAAGNLDLTKYLPRSRTRNTRSGGGENYKPPEELQQLMAGNEFVELLGARLEGPDARPFHGHVLERRHQAEDSAVTAQVDDGYLVLGRPLAAVADTWKAVGPGKVYSVGLALHQGQAQGSGHLVSFPVLFELDGAGAVALIESQ